MEDFIVIGQIIKAQGLKGEIKIKPLTDDIKRFKKLKVVYIDKYPYNIVGLRQDNHFVYLQLSGIDSREKCMLLMQKYICIDRINAVELEEDEYFICDIIGCRLISEGEDLGIITSIDNYGSADVITVKGKKNEIRFPFLKKIVINIDIEQKVFEVDQKKFLEVAVYEN